MHLQRVAVITRAVAHLARNVNVGQEVHLDFIHAVALAGLAASALHVEAEASGLIAAQLRLIRLAEQLTNEIKHACICRRI